LGARVKVYLEKTEKVSKDLNDMLHAIQKTLDNHIIYIFDRAVRRFPEEVVLWNDYIAFLQGKDAANALNAVLGKVLALYPKKEDYWLQASIHELEANSNVHSARITLQRGLRANPTSSKLWLRYFELELWNALRATERQKALDIQEDYEALQGAPMVVFSHAVNAVTDIDAVLEIYSACETVGGDFAAKMKEILIAKHGHRMEVWQHLALSALSQLEANVEAKNAEEVASTVTKGKRKLSDAQNTVDAVVAVKKADETISSVAQALQQAVQVLSEGRTHISTAHAETPVNATQGDEYTVLTVRTLYQALAEATRLLGGLDSSAVIAWAAQQTQGPAKTSATPAGKKKKGDKKTEAPSTADVSNGSNSSAATLQSALFAILTEVSTLLAEDAPTPGPVSPLLCLAEALRHQVHLLCSTLQSSTGDHSAAVLTDVLQRDDVVSTGKLAEWVRGTAAPALMKQTQARGQPNGITNARNELVDAFCVPIEALLDAFAASSGDGVIALQSQVLGGLLTCTTALVTTPAGSELARRVFTEATAQAELGILVTTTLQELISSSGTSLSTADRGEWCAFYLALTQASEAASASDRLSALKSVFGWIDAATRAKPHLFHGTHLHSFYAQLLEAVAHCGGAATASAVLASNAQDKKVLEFEQAVAERSLEACPTAEEFWKCLESVQQRSGDLKGATHTRWRRDKALGV
jgi:hypothetical protein